MKRTLLQGGKSEGEITLIPVRMAVPALKHWVYHRRERQQALRGSRRLNEGLPSRTEGKCPEGQQTVGTRLGEWE